MLDALRHDVDVAGLKLDGAIAQVNLHVAGKNLKQLISVVVCVPNELTLDVDNPNVVVIHGRHVAGRPLIFEGLERFAEIDLVFHLFSKAGCSALRRW